jgi:Condensation domain
VTGKQEYVRLCWGQQWAWREQEMPPERRSPSLIFTNTMDLADGVRTTEIPAAIRLVVGRHSALRSTFTAGTEGVPRSEVWPADAEAYAFEYFEDAAHGQQWLGESLDIRSAWPLRVAVFTSERGSARLGIAAHHIAADRYGFDLLCHELQVGLRAVAQRAEPELPSVDRQPADIAAFESSTSGTAVSERAIAHWLRYHEELGEVMSVLWAGSGQPSGSMHIAKTVSADASRRLSALAAAAHSSEEAVTVAAIAGVLAEFLGRSSVPMFMTSANRHLGGLRYSVCSVAQAGLARIRVADPRDLGRLIPAASSGFLAALKHAYYDGNALSGRQMAAGGSGFQLPVSPPSINVMRAGATAPQTELGEAGSGLEPEHGDGELFTRVEQIVRPCLGLNFHVRIAAGYVSIELRAGTHLLSAADCLALTASAVELILGLAAVG